MTKQHKNLIFMVKTDKKPVFDFSRSKRPILPPVDMADLILSWFCVLRILRLYIDYLIIFESNFFGSIPLSPR